MVLAIAGWFPELWISPWGMNVAPLPGLGNLGIDWAQGKKTG